MYDLILYLAIFSCIVLLIALKARYDIRRRSRAEHGDPSEHAKAMMNDEESSTRRLIGDEAYEKMVASVDDVIRRHSSDRCQSFGLSSGPDSDPGWRQLHKLLPGDPLWLRKDSDGGLDCIDVYSEGYLIGRLMLTAAEKAAEIMDSKTVTGAYVAEQNSYGDSNIVSLRIILFYRPVKKPAPGLAAFISDAIASPAVFTVRLPDNAGSFTMIQN